MIKLKQILNENKYAGQHIFYPVIRKYGGDKIEDLVVFKIDDNDEGHSVRGGSMISNMWEEKVEARLKKHGKPSSKEIKADKAVYDLFWKTARKLGRTGYKLVGWRNFGQGNSSDLAYVYSGKGLYEIYLNLPRSYRHQDELDIPPSDKFINFFDTVEQEVSAIEGKIKGMGFKVQISASPRGYKG